LWVVTRATLIAQITYASPSWSGFIKCDELTRLKAIVSKANANEFIPGNNFVFYSAQSKEHF